jgi:hypothetical protein
LGLAAKWSMSMTFPMGGWQFARKAGCLTPPSTSRSVSVIPPLSRASVSGRFWPGWPRKSLKPPNQSRPPPPRPAPLQYGDLRGAGSRSQRCRRVTSQLGCKTAKRPPAPRPRQRLRDSLQCKPFQLPAFQNGRCDFRRKIKATEVPDERPWDGSRSLRRAVRWNHMLRLAGNASSRGR